MSDSQRDRRSFLAGGVAALAAARLSAPALAATNRKTFPRGFRWGAATAAHQVEGNNVNSDMWLMENIEPRTFADRSGDACDSYHRFDEDLALIRQIGLNSYRFSIEWARIEPIQGQFSSAELDHYKRMIDSLRKAGIDPVVTFFHASAPRWFAEAGGWLSPEAPHLFARYCDQVARVLGDGIAFACTINEPQVALTFRAMLESGALGDENNSGKFKGAADRIVRAHAEGARRTGAGKFVTMNSLEIVSMQPNLIAGHLEGYKAIKAAHSQLPTGVTLSIVDFLPANEGSKHLELLEQTYGQWMDAAKQGDFIGAQVYQQVRIPGPGAALPPPEALPYFGPDTQKDAPSALKNMVEYSHKRTGLPVFVTENGIDTADDRDRAWYIPQALSGLHEAMDNGVPVIGYLHWSLLDNFEWQRGYGPRYGLATVDRNTFRRTLKRSAAVYSRIVRSNAL
jgi:beta-glucosidase